MRACVANPAGAERLSARVIESLEQFEIPATPENYAIWYEYCAGKNPILRRTIDAIVSNRARFDEQTLDDLHANFFYAARERKAIRETSVRVLDTLQDIVALTESVGADARQFGSTLRGLAKGELFETIGNLKDLIEELVRESQMMAGRSQYVGERIRESSGRIEVLERNLASALREANVDGLTGIGNRRFFDASLRHLSGEAMNSGDDLSLLLIDIDQFKKVNDRWGHPIGDEVLRRLARVLEKSVRGGDVACRYGGEEFAVLLPHTTLRAAVRVAENLRVAIGEEPAPADAIPAVTVSIGISSYEIGEPLADWVARADTALYCAKAEGRNCVRVS